MCAFSLINVCINTCVCLGLGDYVCVKVKVCKISIKFPSKCVFMVCVCILIYVCVVCVSVCMYVCMFYTCGKSVNGGGGEL